MTTTTFTPAAVADTTRVSWRAGLVTVLAGAAVTAVLALALQTAGLDLAVDGESVPWFAFAQMVALGGLIGIVLARHVGRTTFLRTTVALTALSCVPSIALGDTVADKLGLVLTHVVAAAIIVPRLARR
jgi:hypothetical protein